MSDGMRDNPGACFCGPDKDECMICKKLRWTLPMTIDGKYGEVCTDCAAKVTAPIDGVEKAVP